MTVPICKIVKVSVNGQNPLCGGSGEAPPIEEEQEMHDIYSVTFAQTLTETAANIEWDESAAIANDLGGSLDDGGDPTHPFHYNAPENGVYKFTLNLNLRMSAFTNTGPNAVNLFLNHNDEYEDDFRFGNPKVNTFNIQTGHGVNSDPTTLVQAIFYIALTPASDFAFTAFLNYEVSESGDPTVVIDTFSTMEVKKVSDYTP